MIGLHEGEVANVVMVAWLVTHTVLGFQVQLAYGIDAPSCSMLYAICNMQYAIRGEVPVSVCGNCDGLGVELAPIRRCLEKGKQGNCALYRRSKWTNNL